MSTHGVGGPEFPAGAAIVFGGSGGLGGAIAKLLAERGTDVSLTYRSNPAAAEAIAKEIENVGRASHTAPVDLADQEAIRRYVDQVADRFGAIHSVIFAAGPALSWRNVAELDADEFWRFMELDVKGLYIAVQASLPHLRAAGSGSIVALGTMAQQRYLNGDIASAGPKSAVRQIIQAVAREEGPAGVRANIVLAGGFEAGMGLDLLQTTPQEFLDQMLAMTPLGRWGRPEELAEVVAFLASNRAGFVTGQVLAADGGFAV